MDLLSVVSLNFRGLASAVNGNNVKRFVLPNSPSVVCLQESICSTLNDSYKISLGIYDLSSIAEVPAIGILGGLFSFWDSSVVKVEVLEVVGIGWALRANSQSRI